MYSSVSPADSWQTCPSLQSQEMLGIKMLPLKAESLLSTSHIVAIKNDQSFLESISAFHLKRYYTYQTHQIEWPLAVSKSQIHPAEKVVVP